MKLKHTIVLNDEEVTNLFNIVMNSCLASYPSPEEQARAIASAKLDFETLLNRYAHKAFKLGKKIAKLGMEVKKEDSTAPSVT